ncbi:MAG: hypothetical protein QOD26_930 [Betaproteobacteria bacterium]|jgi:hypothetical protein|nr:hypothetical protein [Betaproteobacteria bacterium]
MRRIAALLLFFCVLFPASAAQAEITAVKAGIAQPVGGGRWSGPVDSVSYPGGASFMAELHGFEAGRTYAGRIMVVDAKGKPVLEHSMPMTSLAGEPIIRFQHPFTISSARLVPGEWRQTFDVDGVRVVDVKLSATRVGPEPGPPVKLVRALLTSSLSRKQEPRRPLESLSLPSAVYYYVQATGFEPGRSYQVHIAVLDGANNRVGNHDFSTTPRAGDHTVWFPILPRATHAPGTWTFRIEIDRDPLAETRIEAAPGAARTKSGFLERYLPGLTAAVLIALVYVVYGLSVFNAGTVSAAPKRPLLDPALLALLVANLLPLGAVVFAGANAADLLIVYWTENLVIAAYTILRMVKAHKPDEGNIVYGLLIFIGMFGVFCTVHGGVVLWLLFEHSSLLELSPQGRLDPAIAAEFARQASLWDVVPLPFLWLVGALFISHGISFVQNFLQRGEFLRARARDEMMRPFNRIMLMHVASVAMGFFAQSQGSPFFMLAALVALKTAADVYSHLASHGLLPRPSRD